MLHRKVVLGTHSQGWKDEFMRSKEAMISEFRQKKRNLEGKKEYGPAAGQVYKGSGNLSDLASTSKTLPAKAQLASPSHGSPTNEHI
jgi:hypothetical protein